MHSRILKRIVFVLAVAVAIPLAAQTKKPEAETFAGTIAGIEMKGKVATLKIQTDGGDTFSVIVTPKLAFTVTARGEAELLKKLGKEPVMVSAERTVWNEASKVYIAGTLTVYHKIKMPAKRTEMNGGVDFCARLVSATDKEVTLGDGINKVLPEGDTFVLNVVSNDAALVSEGSKVELEGTKRGEKLLATRLAVTEDRELTYEDVTSKKIAKPKTTTKPADKPAAKPADKTADGAPAKPGDAPAGKTDDKPLTTTDPFKGGVKDDKAPKAALPTNDPFKGGVKGDKPKGALPTADPFKDAGKGEKPKA